MDGKEEEEGKGGGIWIGSGLGGVRAAFVELLHQLQGGYHVVNAEPVTAARIGVAIHPSFSAAWLYPRIVWGGLWGLLLLLPLAPGRTLIRGLVVSLGPSLAQLLFFFPQQTSHGLGGVGLGLLTPVAVLIFNAIWGISAAYWIRSTGR